MAQFILPTSLNGTTGKSVGKGFLVAFQKNVANIKSCKSTNPEHLPVVLTSRQVLIQTTMELANL